MEPPALSEGAVTRERGAWPKGGSRVDVEESGVLCANLELEALASCVASQVLLAVASGLQMDDWGSSKPGRRLDDNLEGPLSAARIG